MSGSVAEAVGDSRPIGRPTIYNEVLAADICVLLSEGKSLRQIAAVDGMPDNQTIIRWVLEDRGGFRAHYTRAREQQGDWYADRIIEISEETLINPKDSNAYRVAGDLMKWAAAIRRPRVYGERQQVEHSGGVDVSFTIAGLPGSPRIAGPVPDAQLTD